MNWRIEAIGKNHDRKGFDCGNENLNVFLATYARQAHDSGASKTYVAIDPADDVTIMGFYTLLPTDLAYDLVPQTVRPIASGRYALGGFRLARLAVKKSLQGKGLGGALLVSAARRCIMASAQVGGTMLVIDAKDDAAAAWYKTYGAVEIPQLPLTLVLPYAVFLKVMKIAGRPIF